MTVLAPPPRRFERGTSPQRHPWFTVAGGTIPPLPPDCNIVKMGDGGPPGEDQCPRCKSLKFGVCQCGYDWDNWEWVDAAQG